MSIEIANLRKEYTMNGLDIADVLPDPVAQFNQWFDAALQSGIPEPNAMHLSTVAPDGRPSARIVLIKAVDERGFVFYTNYESQKGQHLMARPVAALTFFYPELERQIRIEGVVEKVSEAESDSYFNSRPRGSQIGAWVSRQSTVIDSRDALGDRQRDLEAQFANKPVPRPAHWGGFRLIPDLIEFWQGRPSRLHDRIRYRLLNDAWTIERVSP